MATTYESGSAVLSGYYLNPASWHVEPVAHDGGQLPAGRGRWMRVPTAAALALVPVLGAAFLIFLPLIGFFVILHALASAVMKVFHASATDLAATVSPGWLARRGALHRQAPRERRGGGEGADGAPATRSTRSPARLRSGGIR